jgi:hypothetical protein
MTIFVFFLIFFFFFSFLFLVLSSQRQGGQLARVSGGGWLSGDRCRVQFYARPDITNGAS